MWQCTVHILVVGWLMGSVWLGMAQAENRALFIGIDDYQSPDIHKLRGAVYDARRMMGSTKRSSPPMSTGRQGRFTTW